MKIFLVRIIVFTVIFYSLYTGGQVIWELKKDLLPQYISFISAICSAFLLKLYED